MEKMQKKQNLLPSLILFEDVGKLPVKKAKDTLEMRSEAVVSAFQRGEVKEVRSMMGSVEYRASFMKLIMSENWPAIYLSLSDMGILVRKHGVCIKYTMSKIGKKAVIKLLVKILNNFVGKDMDALEMMEVAMFIIKKYNFYSLEEVFYILQKGKRGEYSKDGEVWKMKVSMVANWFKLYRKEMGEEMRKWLKENKRDEPLLLEDGERESNDERIGVVLERMNIKREGGANE